MESNVDFLIEFLRRALIMYAPEQVENKTYSEAWEEWLQMGGGIAYHSKARDVAEQLKEQIVIKDQLLIAYNEYIDLLSEELNDTAQMAAVHGWKSHRVERGEKIREKINELKDLL